MGPITITSYPIGPKQWCIKRQNKRTHKEAAILTAVSFIGEVITVFLTVTHPRCWDTGASVTFELIFSTCYAVATNTTIHVNHTYIMPSWYSLMIMTATLVCEVMFRQKYTICRLCIVHNVCKWNKNIKSSDVFRYVFHSCVFSVHTDLHIESPLIVYVYQDLLLFVAMSGQLRWATCLSGNPPPSLTFILYAILLF